MLSPDLLRAATGCSLADAARFAGPLSDACAFYGINTPARLAAFLAQIGHESGGLRFVRELWGPTPVQERYEGRHDLGNTQPGDGSRYRGRGLIQTTGRYNYQRVRDRLRESFGDADVPDFEVEPEALEQPRWAALSAADYWDDRGLNALADSGDFLTMTKRINGGTNGLPDRLERWARAKEALAGWSPPVVVGEVPDMAPDGPAEIPATVKDSLQVDPAPAPTYTMPAGEAGDWQPPEATMVAPILGMFGKAALSAVIDAVPELLKKYSSGSAAAERNIGAATVILDVAKTAVQASNEQDLADKVANDPAAREAVRVAMRERWYDIEVAEAGGGGIAAARKADAAFTLPDGARFWHSPAFWISVLLMVYPTMLLVDVFWVNPERYDGNIRTQIVTGVLAVIMLVGAYWLGTSASSARKTDLMARKE